MSRLVLIAPLAIFGLAGLYFLWIFATAPPVGRFYDSLLPELIGFCLEGFFLVGILSIFQHRREHERRHQLWLSLRGSLRAFLSHLDVAFLDQHEEPLTAKDLEENTAVVQRLKAQLSATNMDLEHMVQLKNLAQRTLGLTHDLIPVAAQLSAEHMRWWIAIVDSVRSLSEAKARDTASHALNAFLLNMQEFDELGI